MNNKLAFEFSNKLDWLNAEPQSLAAHSGRIIALLFWNASSVYCHNILFDLSILQRKIPDALSVLTIHVPKFAAELEQKTIHEVLLRLNIQLPVANDIEWVTWQHYDVQVWPTLILIDEKGFIVNEFRGDNCRKNIEDAINDLLKELPATESAKPKVLQVKSAVKTMSLLQSPSALLLHNDILYIADSGHNRIIECTLYGRVRRIFGNGLPLYLDGIASEASFNRPMGMAISKEYLYVADTGNHAVRRIRLLDGYVDSFLGNGKIGATENTNVNSFNDVLLNNPSDVCMRQESLIIADTGNNRLCSYNLFNNNFSVLAGSKELGFTDGIGTRAELAYPLGLAFGKHDCYFVEGSSSSIRSIAISEGRVNTLFGQGLYQYGLEDGMRKNALLQHPCAIAVDDKHGLLWVADSYNHKIRVVAIDKNTLQTISTEQALVRPCALALDEESLWIADSASNQIHRYYIESKFLSRINIQML